MSARNLDRLTLKEVSDLLDFVPSDDRDEWIRIGGILKDEFGTDGFAVWDEWSRRSARYIEKDAIAVWRSLGQNAKKAAVGTLIYLGSRHGWRRDERAADRAEVSPTEPRRASPPERDTSAYATKLWLSASFGDAVVGEHPYAVRKGINWAAGAKRGKASGRLIGSEADCLVVPIRTDAVGKLQGVQCINVTGDKQSFGKISGGCLVLGHTVKLSIPWYVAEGWASAVSVVFHHHRGNAVCAVAFGKHNLMHTADLLSRVFAPDQITVLQERDA
jgi:hypothetical protein